MEEIAEGFDGVVVLEESKSPKKEDTPVPPQELFVRIGWPGLGITAVPQRELKWPKHQNAVMKVEVLRAKDLKGGSFFDKLDPYCKVQVSGTDVELKTPVLNNAGNNPVWNFSGEVTYISLDEEGLKFT